MIEIIKTSPINIQVNKILQKIIKKESLKKRSILLYLRLYADFALAEGFLNEELYQKRFIPYINIIKNLLEEINLGEESKFIKTLINLIEKMKKYKKYKKESLIYIKTYLLTCQNICIIRLMKISL